MENVLEKRKIIFRYMYHLLSPTSRGKYEADSEETDELLLDSVLHNNLKSMVETLSQSEIDRQCLDNSLLDMMNLHKSNTISIRETFTKVIIHFLELIKNNIESERTASSLSKNQNGNTDNQSQQQQNIHEEHLVGSLSIQHEKIYNSALQFLIVLGLNPYLMSGVGIPVSKRLGPGQILLASARDFTQELSGHSRIECLLPVVMLLKDFLNDISLKDIVINNYLADMLTVLIQIRFCAKTILHKATAKYKDSKAVKSQVLDQNCTQIDANKNNCSRNTDENKDVVNNQQNTNDTLSLTNKVGVNTTHNDLNKCVGEKSKIELKSVTVNNESWELQSVADFCSVQIDSVVRASTPSQVLKVLLMLSASEKSSTLCADRSPAWFRRTVACLLRDIIMDPPNTQHLMMAFVGDFEAGGSTQEWQRCFAVAHIISRLPVNPGNVDQFYSSVSSQLVSMLKPEAAPPLILKACGLTISELYSLQPGRVRQVCLLPVCSVLARCALAPGSPNQAGTVLVSEPQMTSCMTLLHRLYVTSQEPDSVLHTELHTVAGVLFDVLVQGGVSTMKSMACDLVRAYLASLSDDDAVTCLLAMTVCSASDTDTGECGLRGLSDGVRMKPGTDGGLQAVYIGEARCDVSDSASRADAALAILDGRGREGMRARMFICLLERLTQVVTSESSHPDVILPARVTSPAHRKRTLSDLQAKISLMTLLATLTEKYGAEVVESCSQILLFAKATLERCVAVCENTGERSTQEFEWDTATLAMGLLTVVLSGVVELSEADTPTLDKLLPLLISLANHSEAEPAVRQMARDLQVGVATRGLVTVNLGGPQDKQPTNDIKATATSKSLIEEWTGSCSDSSLGPNLTQAFEELSDPMLPVKGHGLISIARMVEDRHLEVRGHQAMLVKVFLTHLVHQDSYIYLSSVNGLAALADLCPQEVIPQLCTEFRSKCMMSEVDTLEVTLKVGETLVKAVRRLGEMTPVFRDQLLAAILSGCRHEDALVRASSLSNLAEVCRLLKCALGPVMHEVLTCCRDVMTSDPDSEPRKAATMTLTLLLQSLGKDSLTTLAEILRDLYRALKQASTYDPCEEVRGHASLALGELDTIMREALFTRPELTKKITVLGYQ